MKNCCNLISSIILLSGLVGALLSPASARPSYENYSLVWSDEFDGSGLPNSSNWSYEEGYVRNNELQYYTRQRLENVRMESGNLTIEARRDNWNGNEYTSASLYSRGKREYQYGIFECRAKIDVRQGSWPAFWTLGVSEEWPSCGEVDIMEYYAGNLHANVAWGTDTRWQGNWSSQTKAVGSDFSNDFHIWRMLWTEDKIELYVDDFLQNTTDLATTINGSLATLKNPFHQKAYILINQAIGSNGGDPSGTTFPVQYIIDYVRVYQEFDTIAPSVTDVVSSVNGTITILFSEEVEKESSETLSNYIIDNNNVSLLTASLQTDRKTVVLTLSGLNERELVNMTVLRVTDDANPANALSQTTREIFVGPLSDKLSGNLIGNGEPWNNTSGLEYGAAVDGNTSTYADCIGDTVWVGFDFGSGNEMVITGARFYPRNDYANRMNGRSIEVSYDGVAWEKVYVISQTPQEGTFTSVPIVNSEPVRFVRYNGTGGYLNVSEFEFLGYSAPATSVYNKLSFRKIPDLLSRGPVQYSCYSLSGRLIESRLISGTQNVTDLMKELKRSRNFTQGLYLVTIESVKNKRILYKEVF